MLTANKSSSLGFRSPERNNYFYGKLLDVYHFTLETNYMNSKRWLINRRVLGYGVVCGLNIEITSKGDKIMLQPGLALDGWGRELIVSQPCTVPLPPDVMQHAVAHGEPGEDVYIHAALCYKECLSDPAPALAGDCNTASDCVPGTIREQYEIEFHPGRAPNIPTDCRIPDLISHGCLNYEALVNWVSRGCADLAPDPCISIVNLKIREVDGVYRCGDTIDLTCRPLVYTNRLLFEILLCLTCEQPSSYPQQD